MGDQFMLDLESTFNAYSFNSVFSVALNLYVQEISTQDTNGYRIKLTALTEEEPIQRHFKMLNNSYAEVRHICIDGDFIPYGQSKYDHHSLSERDRRPDSIIFTNNMLVFLELKVDQEDVTFGKNDDVKWAAFFKGLTQVEDFVKFLRNNLFEVKDYFQEVRAVICMRFEPQLVSNSRRNTELFKRATALGFPILPPHKHEDIFNIS